MADKSFRKEAAVNTMAAAQADFHADRKPEIHVPPLVEEAEVMRLAEELVNRNSAPLGSFRTLQGDLGLRPIYNHNPERIEAHLFMAFWPTA